MEMQPIVDRFQEEFGNDMVFHYLDAANEDAALFEQLALRGHPGFVIFLPDGTEVFRAVGQQDEELLYEAIVETVANEGTTSE